VGAARSCARRPRRRAASVTPRPPPPTTGPAAPARLAVPRPTCTRGSTPRVAHLAACVGRRPGHPSSCGAGAAPVRPAGTAPRRRPTCAAFARAPGRGRRGAAGRQAGASASPARHAQVPNSSPKDLTIVTGRPRIHRKRAGTTPPARPWFAVLVPGTVHRRHRRHRIPFWLPISRRTVSTTNLEDVPGLVELEVAVPRSAPASR